jgi:hypothetical protein
MSKTNFEKRLDQIISAEGDISAALDELEGEEPRQLPEVVEFDHVPSVVEEGESISKDTVDDYKFVRNVLYGLINRGAVALEGSLMIARESEHPRAYEVSSNIMKTLADVSKDLIALQESIKPKSKVNVGKQINVQNNFGDNKPESISDAKDISKMLDEL